MSETQTIRNSCPLRVLALLLLFLTPSVQWQKTQSKKCEKRNIRVLLHSVFFFFLVPLPPVDKLLVWKSTSFTATFSQLFGLNYNRIDGTSRKMFINLNLICMSLFQFKSSWIVEALFVSVCKKVTICVPGSVLFQYPPIHPARPRHMQCIGFFWHINNNVKVLLLVHCKVYYQDLFE